MQRQACFYASTKLLSIFNGTLIGVQFAAYPKSLKEIPNKMKKLCLAIVVVAMYPSAYALDITKEICVDALTDLNLPTEPYEFKDGFLADKHVFDGKIQCYKKRNNIFIASGRDIYAEDGFFGKKALDARDKVLSIQKEKEKALKKELNKVIADAKKAHKLAVSNLDDDTKQQLQKIRDNDVPDSITSALAADRAKKEAEDKAKALRKAERKAEKERKKAEREAEKEKKAKMEAALSASRKKAGFHCLSGWSGAHSGVVAVIKKGLNDPGSFEHDETRVSPVKNGRHQFHMRYRAKNGFGALVVGNATGSYANENCNDIIIEKTQ